MNENYKDLINEFKLICQKKWIKGINNYTNSVGLTFEDLLNKQADSMFFPDYNGIEIKCTQRFSRYPITLFTLAFDGPSFFEMNYILNKYGKNDIIYKDKKLLSVTLRHENKILVNKKYYFQLKADDYNKKLYVLIYNKDNNLLEHYSYINYNTIKNRLELKLSTLAIVFASKKKINEHPYFRYYKISIYKLLSFKTFIDLIKKDIVEIDIVGRISRSGNEIGRQRNKNIVFKINKDNISKLFNLIQEYDNDLTENKG